MFQPGEEGYGGARLMIEDGLIDADPKPDAAFALHIWPGIKAGAIVGRPGPMMASADTWTIIVKGRGGHASMPHDAVDPIPVAFEIGLALHAFVTRRIDVARPGGPDLRQGNRRHDQQRHPRDRRDARHPAGDLRGGARCGRRRASAGSRPTSPRRICARPRSRSGRGYPVTVNDAGFVDFARDVATDLLGADNYIDRPAPIMGAEDFSYVLQRMPGCLMFLGVMPDGHHEHEHVAPCHSNRMMLNEDCMAVGIAMHAAVAHRFLAQGRAA